MPTGFRVWRTAHLISSGAVGLIGAVHSALTPVFYRSWTPNTAWFLGTGLGLILLGIVNFTQVGATPCRRPLARVVRWADYIYAVFGLAALLAVPEPQAYVLVAALVVQAVAAHTTLPGD